jgi:hypothetical protein
MLTSFDDASMAAMVFNKRMRRCEPPFNNWQRSQRHPSIISNCAKWQGITTGDDNRGNRWTTTHWNGFDFTTTTPPGR